MIDSWCLCFVRWAGLERGWPSLFWSKNHQNSFSAESRPSAAVLGQQSSNLQAAVVLFAVNLFTYFLCAEGAL